MIETLEASPKIKEDIGEENRVAHLAEKNSVTEGYVLGTPVQAICGEVFIPTRDPEKFPLCSICKEIAEALFLL